MAEKLAARNAEREARGQVSCDHGGGCGHGMAVVEPVAPRGGDDQRVVVVREVGKAALSDRGTPGEAVGHALL